MNNNICDLYQNNFQQSFFSVLLKRVMFFLLVCAWSVICMHFLKAIDTADASEYTGKTPAEVNMDILEFLHDDPSFKYKLLPRIPY